MARQTSRYLLVLCSIMFGGAFAHPSANPANRLIVPGEEAAAKLNEQSLQTRELPPVTFADDAINRPISAPAQPPFIETGTFKNFTKPICTEVTNIDPKQTSHTGIFDYKVQGGQVEAGTLEHQFVRLRVIFAPLDPENLPKYDMFELCKSAMQKAASVYRAVDYKIKNVSEFRTFQTAYGMIDNHHITLQPPVGLFTVSIGGDWGNDRTFNGTGLSM